MLLEEEAIISEDCEVFLVDLKGLLQLLDDELVAEGRLLPLEFLDLADSCDWVVVLGAFLELGWFAMTEGDLVFV